MSWLKASLCSLGITMFVLFFALFRQEISFHQMIGMVVTMFIVGTVILKVYAKPSAHKEIF